MAMLVILGATLSACSFSSRAPPPPPPAPPPLPAPIATPVPGAAQTPLAPGGKAKVALLLPLSGPSAAIGQAMLDAAQMAMFEIGDEKLELLVRDSGGTGPAAQAAAHDAVTNGARLIIGPLLAGEVDAVKPEAKAAGVAMVAFSTNAQLAGNGTWLLGFDARQEIERVVLYAHAHGRRRFAALAPSSAYGDITVGALRDAATAAGATVGRIARYDPASSNLAPTVQSFVAADDFDAVLLPEGGARLRALAPLLPFNGLDPAKIQLLGTGLWADRSVGTEPALEGAWFAGPDPSLRADFERRFQDLYKHAPPLLATLGYDATALAAVLARNGADFSPTALTNSSGFSGLNGIFRLLPDGSVERGLAVLEVRGAETAFIDPAPTTFQRLTN
jgi:branched-chain amino acid transport system substrate-binding protein